MRLIHRQQYHEHQSQPLSTLHTQISTNSLKTVKTTKAAPVTISAAASTWEGHVQNDSNSHGNNKVPSIVQMNPMNNATQGSKKNKPEALQDTYEEWTQELGLTRYQLLCTQNRPLTERVV